MDGIQHLREQRRRAAQKLHDMFPRDDAGNIDMSAEWNDEKQASYDAFVREVKDVDVKIERYTEALQLTESEGFRQSVQARADENSISEDEAESIARDEKNAYENWLRWGAEGLTPKDRGILSSLPPGCFSQERGRGQQRGRPQAAVGDTSVQTTAAKLGGNTIPEQLRSQLLDILKAFGGVRGVASVQNVSSGQKLIWPTTDSSTEEGDIIAEATATVVSSVEFGQKSVEFDMYTSKVIEVSWEFLQDTIVDLIGHINQRLVNRIARVQNKYFTLGSSTAAHKVQGLEDVASDGVVAAKSTSQVTDIVPDSLNLLIHSIDPAYRDNFRFMWNDKTLGILERKKTGISNDQTPLWLPSIREGAPGLIYGRPYMINQSVPDMAASKASIYAGNFSHFNIFDAMDMELFRLDGDAYTLKRTVGFVMYMRTASQMVDAGNPIKRFKNAAS